MARTNLQCVVVTPEREVFKENVDFVAVPMYDGELGVLPGRAPLIGRLGYGELRTRRGNDVRRYYIDGGFIQVRDDVVTVLTQRAVPDRELSAERAARELEEVSRTVTTPETVDKRLQQQLRARARLRVARHKTDG